MAHGLARVGDPEREWYPSCHNTASRSQGLGATSPRPGATGCEEPDTPVPLGAGKQELRTLLAWSLDPTEVTSCTWGWNSLRWEERK